MAFVLSTNRKIEWPVNIEIPIDGGDTESQLCHATFEILEQKEFDQFEMAGDDVGFLTRVVTGFGDDIKGGDNDALICNNANKLLLFNSAPYVRVGFLNAYNEASAGLVSKNSKGSRATGRVAQKSRKRKSRS